MLRSLVVRDLSVKYQRSALGFLWTLLSPLIMLMVLIAVFSHIVRIPIERYWAFLVSGYFVWNCVQQSLTTATYVLQQHASLSRSVAFPGEVLVLGAAGAKLIEFLLELGLVLIVLAIFHHGTVPLSVLALPALIAIQFVLTVGLMYPIAVVSVLFRDVQHALPLVVTLLFYLSPVFYMVELVPEHLRPIYLLNPFAGLLTLFHTVLYDGAAPSLPLLAWVVGSAALVHVVGYSIFKRYKATCVELA